jgi:hypothetical protein
LEATDEGSGSVYWVRVDLKAPGIKVYVTPLDGSAVAAGWQYRLRGIRDVVSGAQLAVAVNGTLFDSEAGWRPRWSPRMTGDFARSVTTVVAKHVITQGLLNADLLWFDSQLNPHYLSALKPPKPADLAEAKWALGGQAFWLHDRGAWWVVRGQPPDSRTAVAVDERRQRIFLAVGEWVSPPRFLGVLADLGADLALLLDGGGSSALAIGEGARGVSGGVLFGGWRPGATYFGVKAELLGGSH